MVKLLRRLVCILPADETITDLSRSSLFLFDAARAAATAFCCEAMMTAAVATRGLTAATTAAAVATESASY